MCVYIYNILYIYVYIYIWNVLLMSHISTTSLRFWGCQPTRSLWRRGPRGAAPLSHPNRPVFFWAVNLKNSSGSHLIKSPILNFWKKKTSPVVTIFLGVLDPPVVIWSCWCLGETQGIVHRTGPGTHAEFCAWVHRGAKQKPVMCCLRVLLIV